MPVFRVLASRTELYTIEAFFRAPDVDAAEAAFYSALEERGPVLRWDQDYDGSDTEIDSVEDVTETHAPVPSDPDRRVCGLCGRTVRWTGVAATESPTGHTLPGPWIHVSDARTDEGIGL
jgi:hypothetical protein